MQLSSAAADHPRGVAPTTSVGYRAALVLGEVRRLTQVGDTGGAGSLRRRLDGGHPPPLDDHYVTGAVLAESGSLVDAKELDRALEAQLAQSSPAGRRKGGARAWSMTASNSACWTTQRRLSEPHLVQVRGLPALGGTCGR